MFSRAIGNSFANARATNRHDPVSDQRLKKNTWPCLGKPEDLKEQPIGMYHCEFCGEMQIAGVLHLLPQFPSQWEEPFPKVEEPEEPCMVSYPTSPIRMETIESIGAPHTRAALVPLSSFPALKATCPACHEYSVTFTREEERFLYGIAPHTVGLTAIVDKGRCSECTFEFTGCSAESARDRAVQAHLQACKELP